MSKRVYDFQKAACAKLYPRLHNRPSLRAFLCQCIYLNRKDALRILMRGGLLDNKEEHAKKVRASERLNRYKRRDEKYGLNWQNKRKKYVEILLFKQRYRCIICRKRFGLGRRPTVDHIVRVFERPDLVHDIDNMQLLCHKPCHLKKTAIENALDYRRKYPYSC